MQQHKILLISTGGTIAGEVASTKKDADYEIAKADAFSEVIKDTVEYMKKVEQIDITIEPYELDEVDSSNITPEHWKGIAEKVHEEYDNYNSFVVTHGTNTLAYSCAALSFSLENPGKPIVLTGSQVPINQPGSDAKTNLDNAIRVAVWKRHPIRGVICVFGSHIISGARVKKSTEFDYDAFQTFKVGDIGRIGRIIEIDEEQLNRHNSYHETGVFRAATSQASLRVENEFDMRIASFSEFPGMEPELLKTLHTKQNIKGFVIRAFGAGDLSERFLPVLRYLKGEEVPVVVTTQAPNGNATLQVNQPGQELAKEGLVIPAYDMSHEAQVAKLAWLLAKKRDDRLKFQDFHEAMTNDIRGEINVMWEDEV